MPEAKPILPPNPLRDAYALVQGMTIEAQLREVVDQLGYPELIAAEHRTLVRWVDRAATRGALHANTAARKKAQAARLVAGASS